MRISPHGLRSKWVLILLSIALFPILSSCSLFPLTATPTTTPSPAITMPKVPTMSPKQTLISVAIHIPTPRHILKYQPFQPLLAKVVANGPVYVTGDQSVPDAALNAANKILQAMLQHRPDIAAILRQYGAFTIVSSRTERICDLPYFSQYNSYLCQLYGEGGAGGVTEHPITACDEKNLLAEPGDAYQRGKDTLGQNICVHELAHTIMNVGLSQTDRGLILARYLAARQEGLWTGDYAMTNEQEFWAVMSQFYFSAGPGSAYTPAFNHVANGPDALKQYDPATYALLNSIYQGSSNLH